MCGRYTISAQPEQLAQHFNAQLPSETLTSRYNAAPSQQLPVLLNSKPDQIEFLRWGLIPHWSKDGKTEYNMINARAETIREKSSYKDALTKRRCLVLADGFYEWRKEGKDKIPMRITLKDGSPFAFAGLWETWKNPQGELIRSFTIITTEPNELMETIHNRMPVLLLPEDERRWLDNEAGVDVWGSLLHPYPADLMRAYPVSKKVNKPVYDDPSLLEPAVQ